MGACSAFGGLLGCFKVVVLAAAAIGIAGSLGGCNDVSKKQYDATLQENTELREKNAQLEQSLREKDMQLASKPVGRDSLDGAPLGNDVDPGRGSSRGDPDFKNDADGGATATLSGEVLFDSGSATLKTSSRKSLDRIANTLKTKYAGRQVRVGGHTDSDPIKRSKWGSNDALSQARADAVRKYLVSKGVSAGRIDSMGYGSSQPKGSKAASRRVEIKVLR